MELPVTPCQLWAGPLDRYGYPKARVRGRSVLGHRLVYEQEVGPIPFGYEVDHLCFTPACVRPDHLEAVTPEENQRRAIERRRVLGWPSAQLRREVTHCPNGHAYDDVNTYVRKDGSRRCKQCHTEYQQGLRPARRPSSCKDCGSPVKQSGKGRPRLYCSPACRRRNVRHAAPNRRRIAA